jgi:hypothetical protein
MLALALSAALAAPVASAARDVLDAGEIRAEIDRSGPQAVVQRLIDEGEWAVVQDAITRGDGAWVALVPALAPGTDGGVSEGLGIGLAYALPRNPAAVLRVLDLSESTSLGPSHICSAPFIEPSPAFLAQYRSVTLKALASVQDDSLAPAKSACLRALTGG